MMVCVMCGDPVQRGAVTGHGAVTQDPVETAGRVYYGLQFGAALCAGCRAQIRSTGAALYEAETTALCPLCRSQMRRVWQDTAAVTTAPIADGGVVVQAEPRVQGEGPRRAHSA